MSRQKRLDIFFKPPNGYTGRVGGMGGKAACDGAILLQCRQLALVVWMSSIMPGQMIDASTFAVIAEVP